jgi:hypothetical protein
LARVSLEDWKTGQSKLKEESTHSYSTHNKLIPFELKCYNDIINFLREPNKTKTKPRVNRTVQNNQNVKPERQRRNAMNMFLETQPPQTPQTQTTRQRTYATQRDAQFYSILNNLLK